MKKILIIDDNVDFLYNMKNYIKKQGYEVFVTTTCKNALQILDEARPDMIFLDVNVGEEDGRETCKTIKTMAAYRHIPVVLISANHDYGKTYKDYGADLFVNKPFAVNVLDDTLKNYLSAN